MRNWEGKASIRRPCTVYPSRHASSLSQSNATEIAEYRQSRCTDRELQVTKCPAKLSVREGWCMYPPLPCGSGWLLMIFLWFVFGRTDGQRHGPWTSESLRRRENHSKQQGTRRRGKEDQGFDDFLERFWSTFLKKREGVPKMGTKPLKALRG